MLAAAALLSIAGVAIALKIADIHHNIEALGARYTSFCNLNSSINCDAVLSSSFAKIAGIPVAYAAIAAYLLLAALFAAAWRDIGGRRRQALNLAALGVVGSLVFSAYMAFISLFVIETLCLMCMSLYAVALLLAGLTAMALRAQASGARAGEAPIGRRQLAVAAVAMLAATTTLAWVSWPENLAVKQAMMSLDEIREADPEFFRWYTSLEINHKALAAARSSAPRQGNPAAVTIVEFSDFGCSHCKRNYFLMKALLERRGSQIEILHKHFPLDSACNEVLTYAMHPGACRAAEAAECARAQGRYDPMAERLFASDGRFFDANLFKLADEIGLDRAAFKQCLDSHTTLPRIVEDCRLGAEL